MCTERDLRDLGVHINVINGCKELDDKTKALGLDKEYQRGLLFCTYSTMSRQNRLKQIVNVCGREQCAEGRCLPVEGCVGTVSLRMGEAKLFVEQPTVFRGGGGKVPQRVVATLIHPV